MSTRGRVGPRLASTVVIAMALSTFSFSQATAVENEERRLAENEAQLAEVRARIGELSQRVDSEEGALAEVEQQLAIVIEAVESASQAVQRQQQAVDDAGARCADARAKLDEQRRIAGVRLIERYKQGTDTTLQSMLVADDPEEVLNRSTYLEVVSRADQRTSEVLDAALATAAAECGRVDAEHATLERVLEQEQRILAEAEALRNERVLNLAASTQQLAELQAQENHLLGDSRQLGTLARRSGRAEPLGGPGPSPGGWCFPAQGPVTSEFGRRWGRMHEGLDVGAPTGTTIVAAQAGRVTFAGTQGGYGNLMLIDHGGGFVTAYAHQSRFAVSVGQMVACGQKIGEVGSTGNSTGPHLHFEVRVNGSARNPRSYL